MKKIPSIALTKREIGTKKQFSKKAIREAGSTHPEKLEERRDKLSNLALTLQKELADVHIFKKTHDKLTPMEELSIKRTMASMIWQEAMLEAMTLLIDCVSCREKVKVRLESGEVVKGVIRVSMASKIHDIEIDSTAMSTRMEAIEAALCAEEEESEETAEEGEEEELPLEGEAAQEVHVKSEEKKNDTGATTS